MRISAIQTQQLLDTQLPDRHQKSSGIMFSVHTESFLALTFVLILILKKSQLILLIQVSVSVDTSDRKDKCKYDQLTKQAAETRDVLNGGTVIPCLHRSQSKAAR